VLQTNPVMVRIVEAPTPETTVADVLMGSVWFVGVVLLAALVVGLLAGGVFILIRVLRGRLGDRDETPPFPVSPLTR
jgi:hypothetical protein